MCCDGQGLHLVVDNDVDLGVGKEWAGAEAVLMFDNNNNQVNLGYGDYLVTVNSSSGSLDKLDPNVAVGVFTYERYGGPPKEFKPWPSFGGKDNPNREIDLAEISRWGFDQEDPDKCPYKNKVNTLFRDFILCKGNAQFATQKVVDSEISVQRYQIPVNTTTVTLVMQWRQGQVTFLKYNSGNIHLAALPSTPAQTWTTKMQVQDKIPPVPNIESFNITTPDEPIKFIPNPAKVDPDPRDTPNPPTQSCARFHLNFWLGNFPKAVKKKNPPPSARQEVVITNFEYQPPQ
jgi:hypothetical protein